MESTATRLYCKGPIMKLTKSKIEIMHKNNKLLASKPTKVLAIIPTKLSDGSIVWLEYVYRTYNKDSYGDVYPVYHKEFTLAQPKADETWLMEIRGITKEYYVMSNSRYHFRLRALDEPVSNVYEHDEVTVFRKV